MLHEDPILKKRPVNASQRLDSGSRVLFLSLKDVLGAMGQGGPVLLGCVCDTPKVVPPLLRAARDEDAVLVLRPGGSLADTRARHRFFEIVRSSAEQVGTTRPLVVASPPVELGADPESAADKLFDLVDAGYTGLSVLASELDQEGSASSIAGACQAALERELGVELLLAPGEEDEAGSVAAALKLLDAAPDLVGVLGGSGVGLASLCSEVEPVGISWYEGEDHGELREALRNAIGAGASMITVRSVFLRSVLSASSPVARERAESSDGPERARALVEALDELEGDALDRVEARVYSEALDLLSLFRLRGSGRWIRDRI